MDFTPIPKGDIDTIAIFLKSAMLLTDALIYPTE
jgi:hypothetical protein